MKGVVKIKMFVTILLIFFLISNSYAQQEEFERTNIINSKAIENKETGGKLFDRNVDSLSVQVLKFPPKNENYVPIGLIEAAVRAEAKENFDHFTLGQPIPCCDDNGKLLAYHVPVAIKDGKFPDVLSPPSADEVGPNLRDPRLWGAGEFMTYVVSAREEDYPVPLYYQGLPPFLVTYHKAIEIAQSQLSDENVQLKKYFCLGHRGDFFEISSSSGVQILINAHTLQIEFREKVLVRSDEIKNPQSKSMSAGRSQMLEVRTPEDNQQLLDVMSNQTKEAWDRIKKSVKE